MPIIVGETSVAIEVSRRLLERGVYVTGFGYPVVPEGTARVRIQVSAALTAAQIATAAEALAEVRRRAHQPAASRARRLNTSAHWSTSPASTCSEGRWATEKSPGP